MCCNTQYIRSHFCSTSQHLGVDLATGVLGGENAESPPQALPEAKARRRRKIFGVFDGFIRIFDPFMAVSTAPHRYIAADFPSCFK